MTITSKKIMNFKLFKKTIEINLFGTVYCAAHAAFHMSKNEPIGEKKERGVIINVSSVAGFEGQRGQVAYAASKGGVNGLARPMSRDLGKLGIRVVTIAPGVFETPMVGKDINPKIHDALARDSPLSRLGTADEFAHFAKASAENSYLTGCILRLDGGTLLSNV
jgi:NAD(P)-dependent dehydrogenase (short-subunit alcohol dehydrogenase family)